MTTGRYVKDERVKANLALHRDRLAKLESRQAINGERWRELNMRVRKVEGRDG